DRLTLIRIGVARPHNPDRVIREREMGPWNLNLRHVARTAIFLTDRTRWRLRHGCDRSRPLRMARQTLVVVETNVTPRVLMGIVAGCAANPSVFRVVTLRVDQPERLESYVVDSL